MKKTQYEVFFSVYRGSDDKKKANGSREKPFKTLEKAQEAAKASGFENGVIVELGPTV